MVTCLNPRVRKKGPNNVTREITKEVVVIMTVLKVEDVTSTSVNTEIWDFTIRLSKRTGT